MNIEQYTEFYKKYRTYVTQLLTKRNYGTDIISDQDINDLVSEIFINIYNKVCVDKTLVMDEPKRYVSVAAKHAYIDLIRSFKGVRNMRSKMISLDSMTVPYNIDNSVGEEHLRILEEKENMFKAIENYPCELIQLRMQGKTYDQICEIKNLSYTTLGGRIERSKRKIQKSYKKSNA